MSLGRFSHNTVRRARLDGDSEAKILTMRRVVKRLPPLIRADDQSDVRITLRQVTSSPP